MGLEVLTKGFLTVTIGFMFLCIVIIKVLISGGEALLKGFKKDRVITALKPFYPFTTLLAAVILMLIFVPEESSKKEWVFYGVYFIGGTLAFYRYFFKPAVEYIEKTFFKKTSSKGEADVD